MTMAEEIKRVNVAPKRSMKRPAGNVRERMRTPPVSMKAVMSEVPRPAWSASWKEGQRLGFRS
jgi:hypothetical protein